MGLAKTTKKAASRISKKVGDRIVELSLKNPDFGARRLVPLLKDSKIDVSASKVYSILKRRGLQTRTLRLAKLDEMGRAEDAPAPQTAPTPITPEIEEQIVEVSLQNPDHGARRLAGLLGGEGISISSSALYTLLKRHGLQNRSLRLARIEAQRPAEAPAPAVEVPAPYAVPMPEPAEEPEGTTAVAVEISQPSASVKEIPIEKIALAQKDIGLKLMGTVLADDSSLSRAIVQNQKTRQQEVYREGDQAADFFSTLAEGGEVTHQCQEKQRRQTPLAPD
jgi:transposase